LIFIIRAFGVRCSSVDLSLSDAFQKPMAYTIYQNYPNPFYPVTNAFIGTLQTTKVILHK